MTEEEDVKTETPETVETPKEPTLQEQLEDWKNKYFRSLAEGENTRKRLAKEKQEMLRFGIDNAIADFLPALDNFENALRFADSASGDVKNWATGFQMILAQFKEALANQGITSFQTVGKRFDPTLHEAVESVETDESPEGTILQEFVKGYQSSIRVIRPARVKVAKTIKKADTTAQEEINTGEKQ